MLPSLSPQRRRLVIGTVVLALVVVVVIVVTVVVRRGPPVEPVAQDEPGPVLLVPGFGGSTAALEVLAADLESAGRDVTIVPARGAGTGDLEVRAADLGRAVDAVLDETGEPSVDIVGYSAGGVVLRLYVADLGGGSTVRRAVTLSSPHHGTDLAALAVSFGSETCPEACQQLAPDSDLLRELNAGDETPEGPGWVALWTEDDKTVVPPTSGELEGALDYAVQSVCPDLVVGHPDVPRTPAVVAMVESALGAGDPVEPGPEVCAADLSR
ncbi:alpha/beta fold hydrolase [Nocardioides oleivorans]|uniref:Alpha/beta fold hydrolase n=1 Tax=Nocardioides oleivorans TaxID=273676 RepID=A0A4Q2S2X8_9ACTN|nr:alpha/beta fold hydrolase [Nocardioides oleivorans]